MDGLGLSMVDLSKWLHITAQGLNDLASIILQIHFLALFVINSTKTPKNHGLVSNIYKLLEIAAGLMTPLAKR